MHQSPARRRLLDGFVSRLATARDADAYTLRGGMLVDAWVPGAGRRIRDIDVICGLPYRSRDMRTRVREILAAPHDDGVTFEADRFRVDPVWPDSPHPGLIVFARGEVGGTVAEISVDLTFQLDVWPIAERREVGGTRVWTCAHEMVVGTKLAVIGELGPREWRPKDLADIWLVTRRFPPASFGALGEAIDRAFARKTLRLDMRDLLGTPWWREPEAASRWARFVARHPVVPCDLAAAIGEVRRALSPLARAA